ncbi:MAG: hypothetical protein KDD45_09055, partial [Bdellovibrionales bacterium]|nr:hypothetical protein [Bdellovibrionales bacterium]
DSSHSFFDSILISLKKIQENLSHEEGDSSEENKIIDHANSLLQLDELKLSMGLHRRILDQEVKSINSELGNLLKNKETIEYLISLVQKREKISRQINKIDTKIGSLDQQSEKGVS